MKPTALRLPALRLTILWACLLTQASCATLTCATNWQGRLTPWKCERAILTQFPSDAELGHFHHGGEADIFRLPRIASWGDCRVSVDIVGDIPIKGSWLQFWTLTTALSKSCQVTAPGHDFWRGGELKAGPGDGLIVQIRGSGLHDLDNATETTSTDEVTTA